MHLWGENEVHSFPRAQTTGTDRLSSGGWKSQAKAAVLPLRPTGGAFLCCASSSWSPAVLGQPQHPQLLLQHLLTASVPTVSPVGARVQLDLSVRTPAALINLS